MTEQQMPAGAFIVRPRPTVTTGQTAVWPGWLTMIVWTPRG